MIEHVNEIQKHLCFLFHNDVYYNEDDNAWYDRKGILCRQVVIETVLMIYDAHTVAYFLAQISLGRV